MGSRRSCRGSMHVLPLLATLSALLAGAAVGAPQCSAVALVLDFEDISTAYSASGALPANYAGLTWTNTNWITKHRRSPSGFENTIEGNVGIFCGWSQPMTMGGTRFSIASCKVGSAYQTAGQGVTFAGKKAGVVLYSIHATATYAGAYLPLNFLDIDELVVTPDTMGPGWQVVLDNLNVTIGIPTSLTAVDVSGNVGQTVQLSATLTDGTNPLTGAIIDFTVGTWTGSAVTDGSGVASVDYTIPSMGDKTITADYAGGGGYAESTDDATLSVYNNVGNLGLFLSHNPIVAGGSTVATVVDGFGNIVTASSTLTIQSGAGGSWAGDVYTSETAGTWTVTATYGADSDTEDLTVTHGSASRVDIAPNAAIITTVHTQAYTVLAADSFGNTWVPGAAEITWTHDGAGSFTGNTYTPALADAGSTLDIYATVGGVDSDHAALTVIPDGGAGLVLAWDKHTYSFYLCADPTNPQLGSLIPPVVGTYLINGIMVSMTGVEGNRTVTVLSTSGPTNSLQARWYLRGGLLNQAYMYSTINGTQVVTTFKNGRTFVNGAYVSGFWGLTHALDAPDPTTITRGLTQQP